MSEAEALKRLAGGGRSKEVLAAVLEIVAQRDALIAACEAGAHYAAVCVANEIKTTLDGRRAAIAKAKGGP